MSNNRSITERLRFIRENATKQNWLTAPLMEEIPEQPMAAQKPPTPADIQTPASKAVEKSDVQQGAIAGKKRPMRVPAQAKRPRKDSGNQWTELAVGAYLANPNIRNRKDIIDSAVPHAQIARRDGFLDDLTTASDQKVKEYIDGMKKGIGNRYGEIDPRQVFVRANNNDLAPRDIIDQINGLGSGEHKADVLFKDGKGKNHGLGIKASKDATLTNYSIESLLDQVYEDMEPSDHLEDSGRSFGQQLGDTRTQMYFDEGLPTSMAELKDLYPEARKANGKDFDYHHESVPADLRQRYGNLLIPEDNAYHSKFREMFNNNKEAFMRKYYQKLFKEHLPYDLANFNGVDLQQFTKEGLIGPGEVDVEASMNPGKTGGAGAAKQFFTMFHDGSPLYRMESRHKGDPFSSQQLFTQNVSKGHTHRPYI